MRRRSTYEHSTILDNRQDNEERKASTTRLNPNPRYTTDELAPINSTPKKPLPNDPSYLLPYEVDLSKPVELSQESLTSELSTLSTAPGKRRFNERNYSSKRYRGATSDIKCFNSVFINKRLGDTHFFRCYYENDVVKQAVANEAKLAVNFYDDDCDTDDEQINQASALVKSQLLDAIMLAKGNLM